MLCFVFAREERALFGAGPLWRLWRMHPLATGRRHIVHGRTRGKKRSGVRRSHVPCLFRARSSSVARLPPATFLSPRARCSLGVSSRCYGPNHNMYYNRRRFTCGRLSSSACGRYLPLRVNTTWRYSSPLTSTVVEMRHSPPLDCGRALRARVFLRRGTRAVGSEERATCVARILCSTNGAHACRRAAPVPSVTLVAPPPRSAAARRTTGAPVPSGAPARLDPRSASACGGRPTVLPAP